MPVLEAIPQLDFSQYRGEWVIIYRDEIIGHDKDLTKLQNVIDQCPRTPIVVKIPKQDTLIF